MLKNKIILLGGGGHCVSVIDVIEQENKFEILGITDNLIQKNTLISGYPVLGNDDCFNELKYNDVYFLITVGQIKTSSIRRKIAEVFLQKKAATVISPLAYVAKNTIIEAGTIIMHHAIINAGATVGQHCIINTKALIEHGATVNSFCHVATAATVNGDVTLQNDVFVGSNAVIAQGITVPANTIISAGSFYKYNNAK
jgi:sugar O-acyltransferase (sialic acid O-acetyltransferase NeuD family)